MNQQQFDELKKGDSVRLVESRFGFELGEILVRGESWMDDDLNARFDKADKSDFHFFAPHELEFVGMSNE